jgi:hypothetical protein
MIESFKTESIEKPEVRPVKPEIPESMLKAPSPDTIPPWEKAALPELLDSVKNESLDITENDIPPREVSYMGDARDIDNNDLQEAQTMVLEASEFIKENAETEIEKKVAETLDNMLHEGRVVLCDGKEECGGSVYGFFNPREAYIGLDLDIALDYGKSEIIDTLFHEAYHAAQHEAGNYNDAVAEEKHAWNLGLEMKNRYLVDNGSEPSRTTPYTEAELVIVNGYQHTLGPGVFTEIC